MIRPPHLIKRYRAREATAQTATRRASCEEVGCRSNRTGWRVTLDMSTTEGRFHAETIAALRGYTYDVAQVDQTRTYTFPPGQQCFRGHYGQLFIVGQPGVGRRVHANAADWVDEYQNHADRLNTQLQRG